MKSRLQLAGLSAALVTTAAQAEVKINDNLAVSGYAVAALTLTDPDSGDTSGSQFNSGKGNYDAVKFAVTGNYNDLSGKVSVFYFPVDESDGEDTAGILDAYATYTAGSVSITGGKFLSYLGYEAFDPINMTTITYGNSWNPIPAYHTGGKIDFAGEGFAVGASVTDQLYTAPEEFIGGDGDFSNGLGYEFIASFTGIEKLTVFTGVGFEVLDDAEDQFVFDIWASYAVSDSLTIAGEYSYADNAFGSSIVTDYWALFATYTASETVSVTGRVSAVLNDEAGSQFTIAPTYTLTENFSLRGELTYSDSDQSSVQVGSKGMFYAVQGVFKF